MKLANIKNAPTSIIIEIMPKVPDLPRAGDRQGKPELCAVVDYTAQNGGKMSILKSLISDDGIDANDSLALSPREHLELLFKQITDKLEPLFKEEE